MGSGFSIIFCCRLAGANRSCAPRAQGKAPSGKGISYRSLIETAGTAGAGRTSEARTEKHVESGIGAVPRTGHSKQREELQNYLKKRMELFGDMGTSKEQ